MQSVDYNSSNVLTMLSLDIPPSLTYHVFLIATLTYLLIFTCNITMVLAISLNRHLHQPMYVLLFNLHIIDMMGATSVFPHLIHRIMSQSTSITYGECYLQGLLIHLYLDGTAIILTVMAFDRYLAICQPLRYHALMTGTNLRRIIAGIWLTDLLLDVTLFLMQTRLRLCRRHLVQPFCTNMALVKLACGSATVNREFGLMIAILTQVTSIVVVLFTYGNILFTCVRQADARTKALRTCGTHLVVFLVFEVTIWSYALSHRLPVSRYAQWAVGESAMVIPPILNPLIYGLNTKEIRNKVFQVFHRKRSNKVCRQH